MSEHHLCTKNIDSGEICTNRCEKIATCEQRHSPQHKKVPFLVEVVDRLVSEVKPEIINGIPVVTYKPYCFTPQAFENTFLDVLSPARPKNERYSRKFTKRGVPCNRHL